MTEWQLETEALLVEEIQQEAIVLQTVGETTQEVPLEITILTVVGIQGRQGRTAITKEDRVVLTKTLYTVGDMVTLAKEVRTIGEIPTMTKHDNAMDTATECQALAK